MNKFFNALLLVVFFPTMLLAIFIGFDLPMTFINSSGAQMPYRFEAMLTLGLLMLIVVVRRSIRRWMGLRLVNQLQKFAWNVPVSASRVKRVNVYNFMEALVMFMAGYGLYSVTEEAWMPFLALSVGALDNLIFSVYATAKKQYRIGLTRKALLRADREVTVIYFTGLRKISRHQQTFYFDFIKDLQLRFPADCVQEDQKEAFVDALKQVVNTEKVYFSDTL